MATKYSHTRLWFKKLPRKLQVAGSWKTDTGGGGGSSLQRLGHLPLFGVGLRGSQPWFQPAWSLWSLTFCSLEANNIRITRWFYSQVACNFLELHPSSCRFNAICTLQTRRRGSLSQLLPIHFVQSESLPGFCALIFGSYCPGGKYFCACQLDSCIMWHLKFRLLSDLFI